MAQVQLRYREVVLPPPKHHAGKPPLPLWVVHVRETRAPAGATRLEWFLLSTREITSVEQACECLRWYCLRWRIEDWHRVLKSGCRVEALQHKTATRLKRAIALNLVIAWRIMLLTLLGRQAPDDAHTLSCRVLHFRLEATPEVPTTAASSPEQAGMIWRMSFRCGPDEQPLSGATANSQSRPSGVVAAVARNLTVPHRPDKHRAPQFGTEPPCQATTWSKPTVDCINCGPCAAMPSSSPRCLSCCGNLWRWRVPASRWRRWQTLSTPCRIKTKVITMLAPSISETRR